MDKKEISVVPHEPLDDTTKAFLVRHFGDVKVALLEQLGGKLKLSVSVRTEAARRRSAKVARKEIRYELISRLLRRETSSKDITQWLSELRIAELEYLLEKVGKRVPKGWTVTRLREYAFQTLTSERTWRAISGEP